MRKIYSITLKKLSRPRRFFEVKIIRDKIILALILLTFWVQHSHVKNNNEILRLSQALSVNEIREGV
jgi:hypothetical protein